MNNFNNTVISNLGNYATKSKLLLKLQRECSEILISAVCITLADLCNSESGLLLWVIHESTKCSQCISHVVKNDACTAWQIFNFHIVLEQASQSPFQSAKAFSTAILALPVCNVECYVYLLLWKCSIIRERLHKQVTVGMLDLQEEPEGDPHRKSVIVLQTKPCHFLPCRTGWTWRKHECHEH